MNTFDNHTITSQEYISQSYLLLTRTRFRNEYKKKKIKFNNLTTSSLVLELFPEAGGATCRNRPVAVHPRQRFARRPSGLARGPPPAAGKLRLCAHRWRPPCASSRRWGWACLWPSGPPSSWAGRAASGPHPDAERLPPPWGRHPRLPPSSALRLCRATLVRVVAAGRCLPTRVRACSRAGEKGERKS
ncbi:unnamed protein product [Urochloa humidicola]